MSVPILVFYLRLLQNLTLKYYRYRDIDFDRRIFMNRWGENMPLGDILSGFCTKVLKPRISYDAHCCATRMIKLALDLRFSDLKNNHLLTLVSIVPSCTGSMCTYSTGTQRVLKRLLNGYSTGTQPVLGWVRAGGSGRGTILRIRLSGLLRSF